LYLNRLQDFNHPVDEFLHNGRNIPAVDGHSQTDAVSLLNNFQEALIGKIFPEVDGKHFRLVVLFADDGVKCFHCPSGVAGFTKIKG